MFDEHASEGYQLGFTLWVRFRLQKEGMMGIRVCGH